MSNFKKLKLMNRLYILVAVILFSASFTSCTAEDISENVATNQQADDTGGQSGTIPPPPPTPSFP